MFSFAFPSFSYPHFDIFWLVSKASAQIIFSESVERGHDLIPHNPPKLDINSQSQRRPQKPLVLWVSNFSQGHSIFLPYSFLQQNLMWKPNICVEHTLTHDHVTHRVLWTMDWKPFKGTRLNSLHVYFTTSPNKQITIVSNILFSFKYLTFNCSISPRSEE